MTDKIALIRQVRELTGLGLRESKEFVEEHLTDGVLNDDNEVIRVALQKIETREPESVRTRKSIINRLQGSKNLINFYDWEEIDTADIPNIQESIDKVIDDLLTIKDRLLSQLEEALAREENDS